MEYSLTFSKCNLQSFDLISDPITDGFMSVQCFLATYQPLMETLDGRDMSSFVDFFFQTHPCNSTILTFTDEDAKFDFLDAAIDMKLVPALFDVMRGEDQKDVEFRNSTGSMPVYKFSETKNSNYLQEQQIGSDPSSPSDESIFSNYQSVSIGASINVNIDNQVNKIKTKIKKDSITEKQLQAQKSLDLIIKKLDKEINPVIRAQLEQKIQRINKILANVHNTA